MVWILTPTFLQSCFLPERQTGMNPSPPESPRIAGEKRSPQFFVCANPEWFEKVLTNQLVYANIPTWLVTANSQTCGGEVPDDREGALPPRKPLHKEGDAHHGHR